MGRFAMMLAQVDKDPMTARMPTAVGISDRVPKHPETDARRGFNGISQPHVGRIRRAVVVHAGARDSYQVALALAEHNLLEKLVTDFFWTSDDGEGSLLSRLLPGGLKRKLMLRSAVGLPVEDVKQLKTAGLGGLLLDKAPLLSFALKRWLTRRSDARLGRYAGLHAKRTGTFLVSYSYYGYHGFCALGRPDMLFQMHPHPATMRRLLEEEMDRHPESSASLGLEWELALPASDYEHLIEETRMASSFLVASSFTRDSLIEHGAPAGAIKVIPYGVDSIRFHPAPRAASGPLRLLFVGRINERKGLRYLLEALNRFAPEQVELTVCGRVIGNVDEFSRCAVPVTVRPSVSPTELVEAYQRADLFVLPSIAEGFGQVLLEALACGLPILTTSRTGAPDLIEDGVQGFIVEPQRSDLLYERIQWAIESREQLAAMGVLARKRAEWFTWQRFRQSVADAVAEFMQTNESAEDPS